TSAPLSVPAMHRRAPRATLFPYTTLFRSVPVVDRPHMQIYGLQRAKCSLHMRQLLVSDHNIRCVQSRFRHARANHVDAVELSLRGHSLFVHSVGKAVIADLDVEVLLHLVPGHLLADADAATPCAPQPTGIDARLHP